MSSSRAVLCPQSLRHLLPTWNPPHTNSDLSCTVWGLSSHSVRNSHVLRPAFVCDCLKLEGRMRPMAHRYWFMGNGVSVNVLFIITMPLCVTGHFSGFEIGWFATLSYYIMYVIIVDNMITYKLEIFGDHFISLILVLPIDIENPYRFSNCLYRWYRYISGSWQQIFSDLYRNLPGGR